MLRFRRETGEYRFRIPSALAPHPEVRAQVDRVDAELAEGMDITAQQDREDAMAADIAFRPWLVDLDWEMTGLNAHLASLVASGTLAPRPSRNPNAASHQSAIAMLVDRRTGHFLTDATDVFADQMESVRSTYCAHLDIQRIAHALHLDPQAGTAGRPPIIDDQQRYLGKWPCPYFGEIAIGFSGEAGQPFDSIVLMAEPMIAGPEREGYYRVDLKITPAILAQIRAEYREGFRAAACHDCDLEGTN